MIARCGICKFRDGNLVDDTSRNMVTCVKFPNPVRKDKNRGKCSYFIEGDPAFMDEIDYNKWVEKYGDITKVVGEDKFGIATKEDVININNETTIVNNTVNQVADPPIRTTAKGKK